MRIALGISYSGSAYEGWQSQLSGNTVQDKLELALGKFAAQPIRTLCAGRTDSGVHALMQVVHFDTPLQRETASWIRGVNAFLPPDIAVQWAREVPDSFHCRGSAIARRYAYVVLESPVRPSVEAGRVGWVYRPLSDAAMLEAASYLLGEHDFSSFRAAQCQAKSPVKTISRIDISQRPARDSTSSSNLGACRALGIDSEKEPQRGQFLPDLQAHSPAMGQKAGEKWTAAALLQPMLPKSDRLLDSRYWRFEFEANAFLHHMIRNIMGCLVAVGQGAHPPGWIMEVLAERNRNAAAPTFSPDGLYFLGPLYEDHYRLPNRTPTYDWLP